MNQLRPGDDYYVFSYYDELKRNAERDAPPANTHDADHGPLPAPEGVD
jgi:hypothetical protein